MLEQNNVKILNISYDSGVSFTAVLMPEDEEKIIKNMMDITGGDIIISDRKEDYFTMQI